MVIFNRHPAVEAARAYRPSPEVELYAGQQLAAQPEKPSEIAPANIQRVTAWTHGQLMFDNEPLADVVAGAATFLGVSARRSWRADRLTRCKRSFRKGPDPPGNRQSGVLGAARTKSLNAEISTIHLCTVRMDKKV